ncbi:oligosaccharide flippase family protein [Geomonas sp. Red276]
MLLIKGTAAEWLSRLKTTFLGTRRAIEDVIVSMIPQVVSVVTGFVTSILIARGLGPKAMGDYALILSVSGLAAALSDLGIGQTAIRFASRAVETNDKEAQFAVLRWAFRLRMLLVVMASLSAFIVAPVVAKSLWHEADLSFLVRVSLLVGIFTAVAHIPTIYFQSLKRFKMNAFISTGQTVVSFAGILLLALLKKWSLETVITVSVVAAGAGAVAFILLVPRGAFFRWREFRKPVRELPQMLLRAPVVGAGSGGMDTTGANTFAFFMLLSSVLVTITMRADVWMMGYFLDKAEIGLYSIATRFTMPLVILLGALNTALWPRASALTDFDKTMAMIRKTIGLSLLVAVFAMVYSLVAPYATPLFFGQKYADAVLLGQALCVRYVVSLLVCPIGIIGYSFGLVRLYWLVNLLQLVGVVVINMALLPRFGAMGAAMALICNEVIGFIFSAGIIWRKVAQTKSKMTTESI